MKPEASSEGCQVMFSHKGSLRSGPEIEDMAVCQDPEGDISSGTYEGRSRTSAHKCLRIRMHPSNPSGLPWDCRYEYSASPLPDCSTKDFAQTCHSSTKSPWESRKPHITLHDMAWCSSVLHMALSLRRSLHSSIQSRNWYRRTFSRSMSCRRNNSVLVPSAYREGRDRHDIAGRRGGDRAWEASLVWHKSVHKNEVVSQRWILGLRPCRTSRSR